VKEIAALRRLDTTGQIHLQNIHAQDFSERYPMLSVARADRLLHGLTAEGRWLTGLDVTVKAWQLVGKHRWLRALRWPLIKPLADISYRLFARHRHKLAYWLTGQRRCDQCVDSSD
jgi:predicted DCC family thiol-disulfide oxidoreductase YuxK